MNAWKMISQAAHPGLWADQALFPKSCWVTGAGLAAHENGLSAAVRQRLEKFGRWPFCLKCGMTTGPHAQSSGCPRCPARSITVRQLVRAGPLSGPLSSLIHQLKFQRRWGIAPVLAEWMAAAMRHWAESPVDLLIPIPLHPFRRWSRGFNQTSELADGIGDRLAVPLGEVLRRRRATRPQTHTQSASARAQNLAGAFGASVEFDLAGMNVWLVDDVCTTGATLHAAATALRALPPNRRPASISAVVAAVADQTPIPD